MKLSILQQNFSKALNMSLRFINQRVQLPILSNILLEGEKTKLLIQATNLEMSISLSIGAKVEKEGKITIPAKIITDLISNLSPGTINLQAEKEQISLTASGFSANLSGINANDFPKIPQSLGKDAVKLGAGAFLKALSQVLFATSVDETRPVLTGVLFFFVNQSLFLVATDGFRLSQKKLAANGKKEEEKLILPRGVLSELSRISTSRDEDVFLEIQDNNNQAIFGLSECVLASRIIEGEFPDFEKIIPKTLAVKIFLDKNELLRAIKLASVFARESANVVRLVVNEDSITVSAESTKSGSQKTQVEARVEGTEMEIAYNYRFIEEFLNVIESDEVQMEFSTSFAPGVFRDTKDPDFLHLIMPVKIQG